MEKNGSMYAYIGIVMVTIYLAVTAFALIAFANSLIEAVDAYQDEFGFHLLAPASF